MEEVISQFIVINNAKTEKMENDIGIVCQDQGELSKQIKMMETQIAQISKAINIQHKDAGTIFK